MYFELTIEVYTVGGKKFVFIADECSSGSESPFETKEELKTIINEYIQSLVEEGYDENYIEEKNEDEE